MGTFNATFQSISDFTALFENVIDHKKYTGAYSVVPSQEEQILQTKNLLMTDNVSIAPIPSNYGLITWNGIYLTVS